MQIISSLEFYYLVIIYSWYFICFYFLITISESNMNILYKNKRYNWKSEIKAGFSLLAICILYFIVNPKDSNLLITLAFHSIIEELITIIYISSIILNIFFLLISILWILLRKKTFLDKRYILLKKTIMTLSMLVFFFIIYYSQIFLKINLLEV